MLTDSQIRNARPPDRPRKLADSRGLYLHLMPNGGRYWRFDYRFNGKRKTLALGVYPDTSLAKTRARHLEARERLAMEPIRRQQSKSSARISKLLPASGSLAGRLTGTSDTPLQTLHLKPKAFHGDWNYALLPKSKP